MRYRVYHDPSREGCGTPWVFADILGPIYYRATEAECLLLLERATKGRAA
jgi:hypothetical protein